MYKIIPKTLFIPKEVVWLSSCHSTNAYALEQLSSTDVLEGTVVAAHEQTAGKGQMGNSWEAEAGKNLTFSIILKPTWLPVEQQFYLSMAVAVALQTTLSEYLKKEIVTIKWPNDIYVGDHKICGVLIQNNILGKNLKHCVVGIGLNINQKIFKNIRATSLSKIIGCDFQLDDVLSVVLKNLEIEYLKLLDKSFDSIKMEYEANLFRKNIPNEFIIDDNKVLATILGVTEAGLLKLNLNNTIAFFDLKQIQYVF